MEAKEEKVECRECGKLYRSLPAHLRKHAMTVAAYQEKHPGAPLYGAGASSRGHTLTEAQREKQRRAVASSNRKRWRQNRAKEVANLNRARALREMDPDKLSAKMKEQRTDPAFIEKLREGVERSNRRRWSEDRDAEIAHSQKGGVARRDGGADFVAMAKTKWNPSHPNYAKAMAHILHQQRSEKRRRACSKRMRELWEAGHFRDRDKYKGHRYKGLWLRSSWELIVARWLDQQKLTWEYEPQLFRLVDSCDTVISYVPDFYVRDWDLYIEVKADWAWDANHNNAQVKHRLMVEAGHQIVVMRDAQIAQIVGVEA